MKVERARPGDLPKLEVIGSSSYFRQVALCRFTVRSTRAEESVSEDDRGDYGDPGSLRFDGKLSRRSRVGWMFTPHGGPLRTGARRWRAENDACTARSADRSVSRED